MNRLLQRSSGDGSYATFFLAQFDKGTRGLTYVNAGPNPPMLVRGGLASLGEAANLLDVPGTPRVLSNWALGASAALTVSVVEEPVVSRVAVGGDLHGPFNNVPYALL